MYYRDNTHYFVMTAKKQSLLDKGVIINVSRRVFSFTCVHIKWCRLNAVACLQMSCLCSTGLHRDPNAAEQ